MKKYSLEMKFNGTWHLVKDFSKGEDARKFAQQARLEEWRVFDRNNLEVEEWKLPRQPDQYRQEYQGTWPSNPNPTPQQQELIRKRRSLFNIVPNIAVVEFAIVKSEPTVSWQKEGF